MIPDIVIISQERQQQLDDIRWALETLQARTEVSSLYRGYYDGDGQPSMMDEERRREVFGNLFRRFRLNLCTPVVDALVDRLQISGFSEEMEGVGESAGDEANDVSEVVSEGENIADGEDDPAAVVWRRNQMDLQSGRVHQESIACGDSYVIVWPDTNSKATLYVQNAHDACVRYSKDSPGKIVMAAKRWSLPDGTRRLNLYYRDRLEKYAAPSNESKDEPKAESYQIHTDDGEVWPLPNEWETVPVFHFPNNAPLGGFGVSELREATSVQDMVNKSVLDVLVGSEFQAFRQRYAIGLELPIDPTTGEPRKDGVKAGAERLLLLSGEDVRVGEFGAMDLTQVIELWRQGAVAMAQVTGTPVHHFVMATGLVSGESQKTAEGRLDTKVKDRTRDFGETWARVMSLAVRMETGQDISYGTNWADTKPRNEKEAWEVAEIKKTLGVSERQLLSENGYTPQQIEQFARDAPLTSGEDPATAAIRALMP